MQGVPSKQAIQWEETTSGDRGGLRHQCAKQPIDHYCESCEMGSNKQKIPDLTQPRTAVKWRIWSCISTLLVDSTGLIIHIYAHSKLVRRIVSRGGTKSMCKFESCHEEKSTEPSHVHTKTDIGSVDSRLCSSTFSLSLSFTESKEQYLWLILMSRLNMCRTTCCDDGSADGERSS